MEKPIFIGIFAIKQQRMRKKYISLLLLMLVTVLMVTVSCKDSTPKPLEMQPTIDSLVMWYHKMQPDSMKMISDRIEAFLQQHEGETSDSIRRIRGFWYSAIATRLMAIEGRPDSALTYIEQALKEYEGLQDIHQQRILVMANRADCYRQTGQYDKCADGYLQALKMADATGQMDSTKIVLMLGVSTAYSFMGDYQNSKLWWQRTGKLVDEMGTTDQFIYYNNLGNDHYFQQQYEEACHCFKQAIKLVEGKEDKQWDYYTAKLNLSEIYVCLGHADSARMHIAVAESFFRKVKFEPILYYIETEKLELAMLEGKLQTALQIAENSEFKDVVIPAAKLQRLKALEQLMLKTGHYKQAYDMLDAYYQLNDSIKNVNISMQMNTKMLQYEHDKRLTEQQQQLENEKMSGRLGWALLVVALLALGLLVVLSWTWRRKQQMKDILVRQQIISMRMENTRNRITPHFIYNALNHEMLAQLKGQKVDLDALTQLLRMGSDQANVLQTTLAKELSFVDYYVTIECRQMADDLQFDKMIDQDVDTETVKLPAMTIQIFVENAIKHGLRRKGGKLTIHASRHEEATLVEVIDNGVGLSPTYQEHTGIKVVRQTVQMLNEHNKQKITFGISNIQDGCRSWIILPDDYNYNISTI